MRLDRLRRALIAAGHPVFDIERQGGEIAVLVQLPDRSLRTFRWPEPVGQDTYRGRLGVMVGIETLLRQALAAWPPAVGSRRGFELTGGLGAEDG